MVGGPSKKKKVGLLEMLSVGDHKALAGLYLLAGTMFARFLGSLKRYSRSSCTVTSENFEKSKFFKMLFTDK